MTSSPDDVNDTESPSSSLLATPATATASAQPYPPQIPHHMQHRGRSNTDPASNVANGGPHSAPAYDHRYENRALNPPPQQPYYSSERMGPPPHPNQSTHGQTVYSDPRHGPYAPQSPRSHPQQRSISQSYHGQQHHPSGRPPPHPAYSEASSSSGGQYDRSPSHHAVPGGHRRQANDALDDSKHPRLSGAHYHNGEFAIFR
ncbi:hypothetical protein DL93DRAFT_2070903 [Clavulina sp. PMI_390]|nr:hypothetical protein DL93DRAFT_2070903 [Clavulina sp. PMI_390]